MLITNPQEPHMADGGAAPAHPGDPPALPTSTEDADIAAWHRAMDYYRARLDAYRVSLEPQRIENAEKHAQAQAETAVAMRLHADKQQSLIDAMNAPAPVTLESLTLELIKHHPHVTGLTDLNVVDNCRKAAEAFLVRFPR
jgi:hypothetical protein